MRVDSEMREKKATDQRKHGLLGRWHSKSWKQHQLHRLWCPLFLPLQKCLILSFCGAALGPQEEVQRNCPCGTEGTQAHCIPGGTSGKEPICRCRRLKSRRFNPWVGKIPGKRAWQLTAVFLPGESHGQRSLVGYGNLKRVDMTKAT